VKYKVLFQTVACLVEQVS